MNEARRAITAPKESGEQPIKINVAEIPDAVRENLADATLESFMAYIRQPGNREKLEARIEAKKTAQTAKTVESQK